MSINDFQVVDVGGKTKFPIKFPALLKTDGFYNPPQTPMVTHLVIIRDNEEDNAFESVKNIVLKADLKPPKENAQFSNGTPRVGIFIMPGPKMEGTMIEDLCLKSVEPNPAMKCVTSFADCISKLDDKPTNMPKAKVQAFLAAQPEIVTHLGLGAEKGYWDFSSPAFDGLKAFLNDLK